MRAFTMTSFTPCGSPWDGWRLSAAMVVMTLRLHGFCRDAFGTSVAAKEGKPATALGATENSGDPPLPPSTAQHFAKPR